MAFNNITYFLNILAPKVKKNMTSMNIKEVALQSVNKCKLLAGAITF